MDFIKATSLAVKRVNFEIYLDWELDHYDQPDEDYIVRLLSVLLEIDMELK
jgi:hypothetical protein